MMTQPAMSLTRYFNDVHFHNGQALLDAGSGAIRRHCQVETLRHLKHRHLRNILVRLVAEDFRQKKNIVENLARSDFFACALVIPSSFLK